MTTHNVLVPSNFMTNDDRSLVFVIQNYLHVKNVQITLFHAYTPLPEIDVLNNPIMERMASNLAHMAPFLKEREKELELSKEKLVMAGFANSQVNCIFTPLKNDIATDIIQIVREKNFNIVIMNRNPNKIARFFFKSVSKKVADHLGSSVSVLVLN
ncbi:MAG: universal stress protein [Desulfamplus sp.]|nr:universal stress protein [Desulfamplus sp.]